MNKPLLIGLLLAAALLIAGASVLAIPAYAKTALILLILTLAVLLFTVRNLLFILHVFNQAKKRRSEMFAASARQHPDVAMLGDSITHEGLWDEYFPGSVVLNRGIGGDTTQDVLNRLDAIIALQPRKLFVLIGINDLNMGVKQPKTLANYTALLNRLREELPNTAVYVQSILPVTRQWTRVDNADIVTLNAHVRTLAAARGFSYLDLHSQFSDGSGQLRTELSNDGIHLGRQGYALWCDIIRPLLDN